LAAMIEEVATRLLGSPDVAAEAHVSVDGQLKIRRSTQRGR
jgi:hypothetical protein